MFFKNVDNKQNSYNSKHLNDVSLERNLNREGKKSNHQKSCYSRDNYIGKKFEIPMLVSFSRLLLLVHLLPSKRSRLEVFFFFFFQLFILTV
jgi:hypothetical protein